MKAISLPLKIVADVILALLAFLVVFAIFRTMLPNQTSNALCTIYRGISALPLPEFLRTMPEECLNFIPKIERIRIDDNDYQKIEIRLADYIIDCWKNKANSGKSGVTFQCYEIYLKQTDGLITESDVTDILSSKDYCKTLPNNFLDEEMIDYDCGTENKIYWKNSFEGSDVTIIIKYSAFPIHRIEVI